jgi:RNA-binding protein YlmH
MNDINNMLLARMDDLANKAVKTGWAASKFITPAERQSVTAHFARRSDVTLTFDGGFKNAERTRALFTKSDWGEYEGIELFAALKLSYPPQDTLGHRDILGALMGLGIERDTIGDIIIEQPFATFVCLPELSAYIVDNFTKAGSAGIKVSVINTSELPVREEDLIIKTATVASLRLDAVLSAAFRLSRTKTAELIKAGRVSLNHQLCLRADAAVSESSLLSIRGMGRVKLLEAEGVSRKGRIFIKIGIYGR